MTGLAMLLMVFFVSLSILYSGGEPSQGRKRTGTGSDGGKDHVPGKKHAA